MVSQTEVFNQDQPQQDKKKPHFLIKKLRTIYIVSFLYFRMVLGTAFVFFRIIFKQLKKNKKGGGPQ